MAHAYSSLTSYRNFKQYDADDTSDDALISMLLQPISDEIEGYCHRWFYPKTMTQQYDFQQSTRLWVRDDLLSVTNITYGSNETLDPQYYFLYPLNGPPYRWIDINWQFGQVFRWTNTPQRAISVSGSWGWVDSDGDTPASIELACNAWLGYLLVANEHTGVKSKTIGDYTVSFSSALDTLKSGPPNEVAAILNRFKKTTIHTNVKW